MSKYRSHREESKRDWGRADGQNPTQDQLFLGCLLRIADSLELIERRLKEITPSGIRATQAKMEEQRLTKMRVSRRRNIESWLEEKGLPKGTSSWGLASQFVDYHGITLAHTEPEPWLALIGPKIGAKTQKADNLWAWLVEVFGAAAKKLIEQGGGR